jgi:hypothetical protein
MKSRNFSPMGSLHPVLFFATVYVVALLFSIFICSALFYSCNASPLKEPAVEDMQQVTDGEPSEMAQR